MDSWNTKTEEKIVKITEPKITEHKNGVSKKEKGDFFSDFDDKIEEKVKEETEKIEVKEPVVETKEEEKTETEEKSATVEKVDENPKKEEISDNWTNVESKIFIIEMFFIY